MWLLRGVPSLSDPLVICGDGWLEQAFAAVAEELRELVDERQVSVARRFLPAEEPVSHAVSVCVRVSSWLLCIHVRSGR